METLSLYLSWEPTFTINVISDCSRSTVGVEMLEGGREDKVSSISLILMKWVQKLVVLKLNPFKRKYTNLQTRWESLGQMSKTLQWNCKVILGEMVLSEIRVRFYSGFHFIAHFKYRTDAYSCKCLVSIFIKKTYLDLIFVSWLFMLCNFFFLQLQNLNLCHC